MADPTPASVMLAIAAAATRNFHIDMTNTRGRHTVADLAVHRARVDALFADGGPVAQFNAQAEKAGVAPVVMGADLWDGVHLDAVAKMVAGAAAAAAAG